MIRVLHVVPDLVPYGLENMLAGLVRTLDPARFASGIVSLYPEKPNGLEAELRAAGVRLFHLGKQRGLDVRMYPRLYRAIREFRPHILHTQNYVLRYAWPAAIAARVPRIVHTVQNVAEREVDLPGRMLQAVAFRRGVAAVTIADAVSDSFRRVYGIPEYANIPNAIAVDRYRTVSVPRDEWRRSAGIGADEFVYLCVARFSEQKNHAALLDAFHRGPARLGRTRLALAGDGHLRGDLERQIERLGIGPQVTFLGQRSDIADALAACDVFVLPSLWEGNPLSVMEAMAAGCPVIATTVGALPELVRGGRDGWLVPPGDADRLGEAMSLLFDRPDMRTRMGLSASTRAASKFDLPVMAKAYAELYERVLGAPRAGAPSASGVLAESQS